MTISIRRDDEISDVDGDRFRARWHFSFDTYHDPPAEVVLVDVRL